MDAVARRAGVGKSTVYLRWQDKDALLCDAVSTSSATLAFGDTGTLRGDLELVVHSTLRHFHGGPGWATIRVTFDAASSPEPLGQFAEMVNSLHGARIDQICARAVARGELPADVPSGVVAEAVFGTALVHSLSQRLDRSPDTEEELDARAAWIVDLIVRGVCPGSDG